MTIFSICIYVNSHVRSDRGGEVRLDVAEDDDYVANEAALA